MCLYKIIKNCSIGVGTSTTDTETSISHVPSSTFGSSSAGTTTLGHSVTPWNTPTHTRTDQSSTTKLETTAKEEEGKTSPAQTTHTSPEIFTWGPVEESSPMYPHIPERLPPVQLPPIDTYPPTPFPPRNKHRERINSEASEYTAMIIGLISVCQGIPF